MNKREPDIVLETLYNKALLNQSKSILSTVLKDKAEFVCRCYINKAPIRFLMSCMLAKIHRPEIDITKPSTEISGIGKYSGRFYDEKYIDPFVRKYKLPCNQTTSYLTPAFRSLSKAITKEQIPMGRPKQVYAVATDLLEYVHKKKEKPDKILHEIIRILLVIKGEEELRMSQLMGDLRQTEDFFSLASEEIVTLLTQHLNCKGASRLPVLIIASAYLAVKNQIGEVSKPLEFHHAADRQTGSIGDVEITLINDEKIVTCYEVKHKRVTKSDVDIAFQKLTAMDGNRNKIDNYIFITTDIIEWEVMEYAKTFYQKAGVEFVILDCIGFIRHYLHFFHRHRGSFLNMYQLMVLTEPSSSVSQPLKEVFLAIRRAAEADRNL